MPNKLKKSQPVSARIKNSEKVPGIVQIEKLGQGDDGKNGL